MAREQESKSNTDPSGYHDEYKQAYERAEQARDQAKDEASRAKEEARRAREQARQAEQKANQRHASSPAPDNRTAWDILGIKSGASQGEIKQAYRQLRSQYHSDRPGKVPERLKEAADREMAQINKAYSELSQR